MASKMTESQLDSVIQQVSRQLLQTSFTAIGCLQRWGSEFILAQDGLSCTSPYYPFRKDVGHQLRPLTLISRLNSIVLRTIQKNGLDGGFNLMHGAASTWNMGLMF